MGVAQGVILLEQAEVYGWLKEPYKSDKFWEQYNISQEDGKIFTCFLNDVLPKYLKDANLMSANLMGAILEDANLIGACMVDSDLTAANLKGANLTEANLTGAILIGTNIDGADLTGANMTGVEIETTSFEKVYKLHGVDFTYTQLKQDGNLLKPAPSREIIIDRMIELGITDAKGLGDGYERAIADAGLLSKSTRIITNEVDNKTKACLAPPSLAAADFTVASKIPTAKQIEHISRAPNSGYPLDTNDLNPS